MSQHGIQHDIFYSMEDTKVTPRLDLPKGGEIADDSSAPTSPRTLINRTGATSPTNEPQATEGASEFLVGEVTLRLPNDFTDKTLMESHPRSSSVDFRLSFTGHGLPTQPRNRFRYVARAVINWQRFTAREFTRKPEDLCHVCQRLELSTDKFIIQDHSHDRNQQAYVSYRPHPSRRKSNFPLGSGSGKILLGAYGVIRKRGSKCPFCSLVISSVKEFRGIIPATLADGSIVCEASWQVDGREIIIEEGQQPRTRARTRRIRLHWNTDSLPDSFLVLVAPESPYRAEPLKKPWDFESLFLGRSIKTAGHNQALIKSWLDLCDQHHGHRCQVERGEDFKKMISSSYFGVIDVHEMRLTSLPEGAKYIALSYVWGEENHYKTLLENVESHKMNGGLEKVSLQFPIVITDSIKLVRSLGERYLWVDSLCIVQDSDSSWNLNSSVMDLVYGNAYLTICAADGADAEVPLKAITPTQRHIVQHMEQCADGVNLMVSHLAETYIQRSRWNTRGWTFQERLLSKRCLIFAEERVFFQCRSTAMSEDIVTEQRTAGWSIELVQAPLQLLRELESRAFRVYMRSIELYTKRVLSRPRDILAAFNGMCNLMGNVMGSQFLFGLPTSHFDLALLWQAETTVTRRAIRANKERELGRKFFPSWSWCGWAGEKGDTETRPPKLYYNSSMLEGCLANVHQWLLEHTWIRWYIRDVQGNLRDIWNPNSSPAASEKTEPRWQGYQRVSEHLDDKDKELDAYGRNLPDDLKNLERTKFDRTLPDYPYRVSFAEPKTNTTTTESDKVYLQFWTWSAFLKLYPNSEASNSSLGEGLGRYDITDYTGDWCGTIVLDKSWGNRHAPGSEHEFLAISDAKNFSQEENNTWTYYIPKERDQSEWDLFYVLLIEHKGAIAHRVGLGKVFKEAFSNPCLPGREWKEIILE